MLMYFLFHPRSSRVQNGTIGWATEKNLITGDHVMIMSVFFEPSQEHFVIVTFGMEKRKNVVGQQFLSFHIFENVSSSKYEENRKLKRRLQEV